MTNLNTVYLCIIISSLHTTRELKRKASKDGSIHVDAFHVIVITTSVSKTTKKWSPNRNFSSSVFTFKNLHVCTTNLMNKHLLDKHILTVQAVAICCRKHLISNIALCHDCFICFMSKPTTIGRKQNLIKFIPKANLWPQLLYYIIKEFPMKLDVK